MQFDLESITSKLADMDDDNEPPKIKLGDASCAAPFTSKLSNVASSKSLCFCAFSLNIELVSISRRDHSPRPLYSCRNHPDVQDSSPKLPDHRIQLKRAIPRRNQIWRLPGHDQWNAHVCVFPLYLSCQGKPSSSSNQLRKC